MVKLFSLRARGCAIGLGVILAARLVAGAGEIVLQPYHGPVVKGVDTSMLKGKVMCGYQGWFGAPGDGSLDSGWRHWAKWHHEFIDGNATVDLWPDVSELMPAERFPTGFKLANGRTAEVFSSYKKPTVLRHFRWMRGYGIDGVFVQRFAVSLQSRQDADYCNTVLANCREGANCYGRAYAVMYDLSGIQSGHMVEVMNDWRELRTRRPRQGWPLPSIDGSSAKQSVPW